MYMVIIEREGVSLCYSTYDSKEDADEVAFQLNREESGTYFVILTEDAEDYGVVNI